MAKFFAVCRDRCNTASAGETLTEVLSTKTELDLSELLAEHDQAWAQHVVPLELAGFGFHTSIGNCKALARHLHNSTGAER
jgi:hypothetical protein